MNEENTPLNQAQGHEPVEGTLQLDPIRLRLPQNFGALIGGQRQLTTILVRKPDAQSFFRVHLQGVKILELAARAHELYKKQNPDERNKFLRILLSNCTLENGTVRPVYRKPFDILARGVESKNWGE